MHRILEKGGFDYLPNKSGGWGGGGGGGLAPCDRVNSYQCRKAIAS